MAKILVLNGVGSAGKSSIAKELQAVASTPFLHVEMDAFIDMMPAKYLDHPDGLTFMTRYQADKPAVEITAGPVSDRLMSGMRHALVAMADQGNNLIIDIVITDNSKQHLRDLLKGHETHFVGVIAPLEILEEREISRGDRMPGLARWQYNRVNENVLYDLIVDTSLNSARECAMNIKAAFSL